MNWHEEVLDASGKKAVARLAPLVKDDFYLAGGTALALKLGHRISLDLDFFSDVNPLEEPERRSLLRKLESSGEFEVLENKDGTCHLRIESTAVSLFRYPYPLLSPTHTWSGLKVASLPDIAAMKISAVIGRGSRKDFIDLYALCGELGLEAVLRAATRRFPHHADLIVQAARALVYFEDAEKEPMPRLLRPLPWSRVKSFLETEVPKALRRRL